MTTARKRHTCCWCGEPIEPGDTYHRETVWGDDGPWTWRTHPECERAWQSVPADDCEIVAECIAVGDYEPRGRWEPDR